MKHENAPFEVIWLLLLSSQNHHLTYFCSCMFHIRRTPEIKEARKRYDDACSHHKEMTELRRAGAGAVSSEDLKDDMRKAEKELKEAKRN
ncbi:hypothetical protein [Vibrio splendidus]|uniref:hypothetical protein n=1 Tax=Vibrio splendidus TaxID=29497 RepID=UPI001C066B2E|nr:hypothetical protein [Vibrio splendidus]MBU2907865.1 hypothetical protein [Vibrio splendidus]MDO6530194.1 hypothetical protein [Vibrio splendidus]MDO6551249.1 hypothetical protein [Vibrio splendidus]